MKTGIIFYTDNLVNPKILSAVTNQLNKVFDGEIVSCTLKPLDFGKNIVLDMERGYEAMFTQIVRALEASTADVIYMTEHDVLYPKEHFTELKDIETGKFYYNQYWWKIGKGNRAVRWDADQVSGLCAYRETLLDFYHKRLAEFDKDNFDRRFEPMSRKGAISWKSSVPYVDIRHSTALTKSKWSLADFRDKSTAINFEESTVDKIPGWENLGELIQ